MIRRTHLSPLFTILLCALAWAGVSACGTEASSTDTDAGVIGDDAGDASGSLDVDISDPDGGTDAGPGLDVDIPDTGGTDVGGTDTGGTDAGGGEPRPGGGACQDDFDCPAGTYCEFSFGAPYCNPFPDQGGVNCNSNADCILEDSDGAFCCTEAFGSRVCTPAGDAGICGEADGEQGDSCADGGQSDCVDGSLCLFNGRDEAYCSEVCRPAADDCPSGAYCFATGGGQGLCVQSGDIDDGEPCADDFTGCDEQLFCVEYQGEDDPYAFCALQCERDRDCEDGQTCDPFGICVEAGDGELGDPCVEDRFSCGEDQFCVAFGGRGARCSELCDSDGDCGSGSRCNFFAEGEGYCIPRGERRSGEYCGDDPFSCAGLCTGGYQVFDAGAYCQDTCSTDDDCPDNGVCEDFEGSGRFCQPAGDLGQGESCALDPFDCREGSFCIDYGTANAFCAEGCFDDADCDSGTWCSSDGEAEGVCIPGGDLGAGETCDAGTWTCEADAFCAGYGGSEQCFVQCDDGACPDGQYCLEPNEVGTRWCFPEGDRGYGEGCADDPYACAADLFCVDAALPQARCATSCTDDDECEGDDVCRRDGRDGACVPPGDVGPLGSCADDVYACEPGTRCLLAGTPGAFCGEECTGFADSCEGDTACRFVGYGRSFCLTAGDIPIGESCADDQFGCEDGGWCVNAGTEDAVCVRTCSFDPDVCEDETTCRFVEGGLGVCLRAGLSPEDPLNPGGNPL